MTGEVVEWYRYATDLYCVRLRGKNKGEHFVRGDEVVRIIDATSTAS